MHSNWCRPVNTYDAQLECQKRMPIVNRDLFAPERPHGFLDVPTPPLNLTPQTFVPYMGQPAKGHLLWADSTLGTGAFVSLVLFSLSPLLVCVRPFCAKPAVNVDFLT